MMDSFDTRLYIPLMSGYLAVFSPASSLSVYLGNSFSAYFRRLVNERRPFRISDMLREVPQQSRQRLFSLLTEQIPNRPTSESPLNVPKIEEATGIAWLETLQQRVEVAKVVLVANRDFGTALYDRLIATGIRQVDLIDLEAKHGELASQEIVADGDLEQRIRAATFVLMSTGANEAPWHVLNFMTLKLRIPWLMMNWTANCIRLGPTIVPYETPCYECYRRSPVVSVHEDSLERRRVQAVEQDTTRGSEFVGDFATDVLVLDIYRILMGRQLATYARAHDFDVSSGALTSREIYKAPDCSACKIPPA
jgi:bacteriocin biosynthesis cyclodehydratase domain-containing protein